MDAETNLEAYCSPSTIRALTQEQARRRAGVFKALAEPLRLRMISAIATDPRGETCVCDLQELAPVSQPTISHHLKVLRDAGLVDSQRRGTWVWYRLAEGQKEIVAALLAAVS